jgi:hypothetical protein
VCEIPSAFCTGQRQYLKRDLRIAVTQLPLHDGQRCTFFFPVRLAWAIHLCCSWSSWIVLVSYANQSKANVDDLSIEVQITGLQAKHFTNAAAGHAQHRKHRGVGFLGVVDDFPTSFALRNRISRCASSRGSIKADRFTAGRELPNIRAVRRTEKTVCKMFFNVLGVTPVTAVRSRKPANKGCHAAR